MTQDNLNNYLYDGEGRICAVQNRRVSTITGDIYDAEGARVAKGALAGFNCGATFTATNSYVLGPSGEQLTETDGNGNWKNLGTDGMFSAVAAWSPVWPGSHLDFEMWGTMNLDEAAAPLIPVSKSVPVHCGLIAMGGLQV